MKVELSIREIEEIVTNLPPSPEGQRPPIADHIWVKLRGKLREAKNAES